MNCNIDKCDCNKSVVACNISDLMYPAIAMFSNLDEIRQCQSIYPLVNCALLSCSCVKQFLSKRGMN